METEGPKTEHGGEQPGTTNNVVPFPRDWLGPREELIPFGSSAVSPADGDAVAPGAEAFWGGESEPLHAVLPAGLPAATGVAGARLRTGAARLAVGGLIAAVLVAAVLGRILGAPVGGSGPVVGSDVAAAGFFDLAELRGAVGTPVIESSPPAVHHVGRHRARPAAHVRRRQIVAARASGTSSSAAASSSTSPAVTASKSTTQTASSTSTSGPTATSSAPTHSSATSHTAKAHPGPVGPGAPFGPGQLK